MANTPVEFTAWPGLTLTVELRSYADPDAAAPANGAGGDAAVERTNATGQYVITVAEVLAGWHRGRILESGAVIGFFDVYLADTTDLHRAGSRDHGLHDAKLVDTKTIPESLQIIGAVAAGKVSGAGLGTEIFVGLDGVTTRVTVTVDNSGNRTAVVYA